MQFHLNGFRPGNPEISEAAEPSDAARRVDALPAEVDVLIVGCGPAGLTLAAQLAAFPDIKTRIVEQKPGPLLLGQADGVACRTMEMFEAFGFSERVMKEAYWVNETSFWKPDDNERANIVRSGRIQDVEDGLSEFPHVILNQARVHEFYLDVMRNAPTRLEPDYSRQLLDLTIVPPSGDGVRAPAYPVTVRLKRVDPAHAGQAETVKARFVVGCDGARSAVRKSLGLELHGDSANQAWGVMDVLAITDFPDFRLKSAIQSANEGNLLIIPREGGYLVRLYIELEKLSENERVSSLNVTPDRLIAAAQRILHPYSLEVKEIAWWSVYEIGQRLCDRYDNLPEKPAQDSFPRAFIAGDACHTHSPKAGQGMNVSMQDAFNLGWKLASVLRGRCSPEILRTYSVERQSVAKELIDFDRKWARMFSAPPKDPFNAQPRRRRSGGVPKILHQAGALHRGNGNPLRPVDHLRQADLSASRRGLHDRHALSFGAGDPPRRRQDGSPRPHRQGGRPVAGIRVRRCGKPRRFVLEAQSSVRVSRRVAWLSGHAAHSGRSGYQLRNRCPGDIPAEPSRTGYRSNARSPPAA